MKNNYNLEIYFKIIQYANDNFGDNICWEQGFKINYEKDYCSDSYEWVGYFPSPEPFFDGEYSSIVVTYNNDGIITHELPL